MDLQTKSSYLKQSVNSVSRHDDAPIEEVEKTLNDTKAYIDAELKSAKARRAEAAKTAEEAKKE